MADNVKKTHDFYKGNGCKSDDERQNLLEMLDLYKKDVPT